MKYTTEQIKSQVPHLLLAPDHLKLISAAWERLDQILGADNPSLEAAKMAAASYASGDLTIERTGERVSEARNVLAAAMDRLQGVIVAAALNGVPETRIAAESGVDRMTVRARLGK